ncbi:transcriptional regulator FeaR [Pseudomonas sp. Bout1]|uniref:transcriptional regulator FeaR n=1 Tax=Pseudomonas sp. Bout1 TaxID=3048600 RepID=UPI002AB53EBA|nr:transcriptional regulator FeaR [Pseudomonas sp. Bout1]MDY7532866.1 transcriptional regulator FeaR [Pseudomonas sp. Bout1]MEB0187369.1 transcriptional regulator FeaR [Pseudomonas sp. Bout1]
MNQDGLRPETGHWDKAIRSACGSFTTYLRSEHSLFIGEMMQRDLGGVGFAELRTNAGRIAKFRQNVDNADDRYCFLIVQRKGFCQLHLDGHSIELAPGELAIMDQAGECSVEPQGLIEQVSISISRDRVRALHLQGALSGKLQSNCPSGRLLRSLVNQIMHDQETCFTGDDGLGMQDALIALLLPTLVERASSHGLEEILQINDLRRQIERMVSEHLHRPDLSPEWMANQLGISIRHLYRSFENSGDSVCRFIQRARLQRCASDLGNPCLRHENITEIAYRWGFSDSAHFSKIFKKQYLRSPRDFRGEAVLCS